VEANSRYIAGIFDAIGPNQLQQHNNMRSRSPDKWPRHQTYETASGCFGLRECMDEYGILDRDPRTPVRISVLAVNQTTLESSKPSACPDVDRPKTFRRPASALTNNVSASSDLPSSVRKTQDCLCSRVCRDADYPALCDGFHCSILQYVLFVSKNLMMFEFCGSI
jgi:hypothetical protein